MASKSIDIIISTVLKKTGIDAARSALSSFAKTAGHNLMNVKAGFDMAASAVSKFVGALSKGMAFETMTTRFKTLTGSMELAKAHMKDLQDLGRTPPFSLEEFAAASQAMMKMTGGMAGFKNEMEIVGDLAAATGNDIATVGRAFGLAYQVIRDGQDFGRAGQQLYSLGIMTKKQVAEFAELSKAGEDNAAVWAKLQEVFGRYKGAMAETEKTTKGLIDAIQGEATVAITDFSAALSEEAKPALEGLLGWMKRINEDGTIEDWADNSVSALGSVCDAARGAVTAFSWLWKAAKTLVGVPMALGAGFISSKANGGNARENREAAAATTYEFLKGVWGDQDAEEKAAVKSGRAIEKAKRRAEQDAKKNDDIERRRKEDLARGQEETDRKRSEAQAALDMEAAWKAEDERLKAVEAERKARERMEADLHQIRIQNTQAEIKAAQDAGNAAANSAAYAKTEFDRAFAMYRSEDKGAAQIAEERAYAADYKSLKKDAARYGGKWRIDELSALMAAGDAQGQAAKLEEWRKNSRFTPEVESMVRAAAADNTRTSAEDELRKISANTEGLAQKLDELLSMKA